MALLVVGFWMYCVVDAATAPKALIRRLPKSAWLAITVLLPLIGSVAWLVAGRPRAKDLNAMPAAQPAEDDAVLVPQVPPARAGYVRPLAPDDDPEFLAEIGRRLREQRHQPPA